MGTEGAADPPVKGRVLQALITITATRGLDQATMREVAREAGVSVGTVQYYCRTRDEMLAMAHRHVIDRIIDRGRAVPRSGPVGAVIRAYAHEFLPLDEDRAIEQRVYLAFAARAAVAPKLATIQQSYTARLHADCADALRLAQQRGEARGSFDPRSAARVIVVVLDGLVLNLLTDPEGMPPAAAVALLDDQLSRLVDIGRD